MLSPPLKPGFGEINIVLDPTEHVVVDGLFVAEGDNGFAFGFQRFTGQVFEVL
jgi:hypothetical protein